MGAAGHLGHPGLAPRVPGVPGRLVEDRAAPEVLFGRGAFEQLDGPCVALVGTRAATHYGTGVAAELGAELSAAGIVVVSGLAAGIDSAAHEGALAPDRPTPPVAVVGGGVDVVYPASSRRLWARLNSSGGICSEAPSGAGPEAWRFPLRNRLIAALAHVVVVVESHISGGALHTVSAADERGVTVLAVPGSVKSPASAGTNSLIADGCGVARDAPDVLAALELACAGGTRSGLMDSAAAVRARSAAADEGVPAGLSAAETAVLAVPRRPPTPSSSSPAGRALRSRRQPSPSSAWPRQASRRGPGPDGSGGQGAGTEPRRPACSGLGRACPVPLGGHQLERVHESEPQRLGHGGVRAVALHGVEPSAEHRVGGRGGLDAVLHELRRGRETWRW